MPSLEPVIVAIGGRNYNMRWEIGPADRFEREFGSDNGLYVAWEASAFRHHDLLGLWAMALRCKTGLPNLADDDAADMLQAFVDEGNSLMDARTLIGRAGIAGNFLAEEAKPSPKAGATAPGARRRKKQG